MEKNKIELIIKNCIELEEKVNRLSFKVWVLWIISIVLITLLTLRYVPCNKYCNSKNNSFPKYSNSTFYILDFVLSK